MKINEITERSVDKSADGHIQAAVLANVKDRKGKPMKPFVLTWDQVSLEAGHHDLELPNEKMWMAYAKDYLKKKGYNPKDATVVRVKRGDVRDDPGAGDDLLAPTDEGYRKKLTKESTMKINEVITESRLNENDPHGTDDVDWNEVRSAVIKAAKKVHGNVDKSKIEGVMKNLYKHKPNDTENAIQIGTDMLRSKNESAVRENSEVAEIGRALMDMAVKQKDDELSNQMSAVGDALTRFGTNLGPKSIKDIVKQTGVQPEMIQKMMAAGQKHVEKHGPVRSGVSDMDDDGFDEH